MQILPRQKHQRLLQNKSAQSLKVLPLHLHLPADCKQSSEFRHVKLFCNVMLIRAAFSRKQRQGRRSRQRNGPSLPYKMSWFGYKAMEERTEQAELARAQSAAAGICLLI